MPKTDSDGAAAPLRAAKELAQDPATRVIRVDKAIQCCEAAVSEALEVVDSLCNLVVVGAGSGSVENLALALVSKPAAKGELPTLPTVRWVSPRTFGAVILGAGITWDVILNSIAAKDLAGSILTLTSELRDILRSTKTARDLRNPCERCMRRRAFPQTAKRRRADRVIYSRRSAVRGVKG